MTVESLLPNIDRINRPSVADQIFSELYHNVVSLKLLPGAKISEAEVAKAMGVSRQPVRDAFFRLSNMGFLEIRPQRATKISKISEQAVLHAQFIRTALEIETVRIACEQLNQQDFKFLREILDEQEKVADAPNKMTFHSLDDMFHRELSERAGAGFVWRLIQENKGHMDRVRFLSLSYASYDAHSEHTKVLDAIEKGDPKTAIKEMRAHLATVVDHIQRIRSESSIYFAEEELGNERA